MTFSELNLLMAIEKLNPGGRDYITDDSRLNFALDVQREFCLLNRDSLFPYSTDDVFAIYYKYRKNSDTKIKAQVALVHGAKCYFANRGKGPCSDDVDAGHVVPRSQGGELSVENCQIECSAHNRQRGSLLVEQYLRSELTTINLNPLPY